jgi:hypothetical protein
MSHAPKLGNSLAYSPSENRPTPPFIATSSSDSHQRGREPTCGAYESTDEATIRGEETISERNVKLWPHVCRCPEQPAR